MNENLKNYSEQPDPKVWESIQKDEQKAYLRRQLTTGLVGGMVVALAIVGVVLWPNHRDASAPVSVDQNLAAVQEVSSQSLPQENSETQVQLQDNQVADAPKAKQPVQSEMVAVQQPVVASVVESSPKDRADLNQVSVTRMTTVASNEAPVQQVSAVVERDVESSLQATLEQERKSTTTAPKSSVNTNVPDTILWVPNVFAPSSDNADLRTFRARLNRQDASISNFKMTIFNRAGHQVFSSMDINTEWDGTYKGARLPQGSYVYVLYYQDADGFQHQRKGTVTLVR